MNDLERLERQALDGDVQAATRWLAELRRQGLDVRANTAPDEAIDAALSRDDHRGLAALALALERTDRVVTALSLAWQQKQWRRLSGLGRALGIALDDAAREAVDELVGRVNRNERLLSRDDLLRGRLRIQTGTPPDDRLVGPTEVLDALVHARLGTAGLGVAVGTRRVGGAQAVVVAVRLDDGALVLGITRSPRRSPGSAWPELQPWRKELAANRETALGWAARRMPDRVRLAAHPLPDDAEAWLERAAPDAADPVIGTLLAEPSRLGFNKLVAQLNKARGKDRERLASVLERRLASWPDAVRVGTRRSLESLAVDQRKGTWRPGWRLVRRLELDDKLAADDPGLDALLDSPLVNEVREIALTNAAPDVLTRLLSAPWPALRRIELEVDALPGAVDALVAVPGLAARIEAVDLAQQMRAGERPAELRPSGVDGITLVVRWPLGTPCDAAVGTLLEQVAPVQAVETGWYQGGIDWLAPAAAQGALRQTHHLSVSVEYEGVPALRDLLTGPARPVALETLVLGWLGDPLDAIVELANTAPLRALRRFALHGVLPDDGLVALCRTEMAHDLEALCLWPLAGCRLRPRVLVEALSSPALASVRTLGLPKHEVLYVVRQTRDAGRLAALTRLLVADADDATVARLQVILDGVEVRAVLLAR